MSDVQNEPSAALEQNAAAGAMIKPTPELVEQAYAAIMDGELPPEIGDSSITARAIQQKIREGESFDDVFAPQSLKPLSDFEGQPVVIYGFHLNPSSFYDPKKGDDAGPAAYAVVEIGDPESGELITVGTGGGNVLVQLVKAWEKGWFPFQAILREKDTRTPGRSTYWLEKVQDA